MSKVTFPILKVNDRIVFNADGTYVLLDTGFPLSCAVDGKIGPFSVRFMPEEVFDSDIKLTTPDGAKVKAILSPNYCYNCHLTQNGLTITDEEEEIPPHDYFLPFVERGYPIVEGTVNGTECRLFFDSGARMTMFGEEGLAGGKPSTGSYTEWMAMIGQNQILPVYDMALDFPCGLHYEGKGALVTNEDYQMNGQKMGFRAMLGIDLFNKYDLYFSMANSRRGLALAKRN